MPRGCTYGMRNGGPVSARPRRAIYASTLFVPFLPTVTTSLSRRILGVHVLTAWAYRLMCSCFSEWHIWRAWTLDETVALVLLCA